jgi:hypothetical protein
MFPCRKGKLSLTLHFTTVHACDNHIAEIVWIAFDGRKGLRSVKYGTPNNIYSGCKTCIVMPVVMDCQEKINW